MESLGSLEHQWLSIENPWNLPKVAECSKSTLGDDSVASPEATDLAGRFIALLAASENPNSSEVIFGHFMIRSWIPTFGCQLLDTSGSLLSWFGKKNWIPLGIFPPPSFCPPGSRKSCQISSTCQSIASIGKAWYGKAWHGLTVQLWMSLQPQKQNDSAWFSCSYLLKVRLRLSSCIISPKNGVTVWHCYMWLDRIIQRQCSLQIEITHDPDHTAAELSGSPAMRFDVWWISRRASGKSKAPSTGSSTAGKESSPLKPGWYRTPHPNQHQNHQRYNFKKNIEYIYIYIKCDSMTWYDVWYDMPCRFSWGCTLPQQLDFLGARP